MHPKRSSSSLTSAVRWAFVGLTAVVTSAFAATGCLDRPLCDEDCRPRTTNIFVDQIEQTNVDKIDLLFMIDNSASMADKQVILREAVPDLVNRLVNPVCVSKETGQQTGTTPANPDEECPDPSTTREFQPIKDIHIGVVSSSLGSFGANTCEGEEELNDSGRLVGARGRAFAAGLSLAAGPDGLPGFLDWNTDENPQPLDGFVGQFQTLVTVVGELGCGFEASLEAWYRFLIDPIPPQQVTVVDCGNGNPCAQPQGIDQALLQQRQAFLRPDSLVAIIMLTDENDCSMQNTGQLYYPARSEITLPRASSVCAVNPNDPCCYSCGTSPPGGCAADANCQGAGYTTTEDPLNLRCFAQKARFGLSFLFPTERYVNALTQFTLCPANPDLSTANGCAEPYENPLYIGGLRGQSLVFLAGIVGVPWQDIAAAMDANGNPIPPDQLRFQTYQQMTSLGTWDVILGDPKASPPRNPSDPLMIESIDPRPGSTFFMNQPLSIEQTNSVNGHEWNPGRREDLQYACIFPLPPDQTRDCNLYAQDDPRNCDCKEDRDPQGTQNPLCQQNAMGPYGNTQFSAKAYPGIRELQVLKDFGANSIIASICARNVTDRNAQDFGYRPAIAAIVDRLKDALSGRCLPRQLNVDDNGDVPCRVLEAVPQPNLGCARAGRADPNPDLIPAAFERLEQTGKCGEGVGRPCNTGTFTMCEIVASKATNGGDPNLIDCLEDLTAFAEPGYCYVDPALGQQRGVFLGDENLVAKCPATEKRLLRFVGDDTPYQNATVLIACIGAEIEETTSGPPPMMTQNPMMPAPDAGP